MDLIEQYLRTKLLERDDITTKSGYIIKILSSYIGNSDIERLRSKIANNNAQNNGCVQGFVIVAKRKGKSNDNATASDSELYDDIVAAMQSNQTLMKYYNKDYRIILSEPRSSSRDRRKVYAAWILDMRESSRFKILLNRISSIFNKIDDLNWTRQTEAFKFLTDDVIIIPQKTAIKWTESIENFLQNLQDKDAYTYNRLFPANDKYSTRILNSIPNFNEMLSGVKIDQEQGLENTVKIDAAWVEKNGTVPFRGTAAVTISPVTGEMVVTPIQGKLFMQGASIYDIDPMDPLPFVIFNGTYDEDGRPMKGELNLRTISSNTGTVNKLETGDPIAFTGTLTTDVNIDLKKQHEGTYEWLLDKGTTYYYTTDTVTGGDIDYAFSNAYEKFEGTYNGKTPLNGTIYTLTWNRTKKQYEDPWKITGKVSGGKVKKYGTSKSFPYTYDLNTYYLDTTTTSTQDDTESVYGYFANCGRWIQVPKQTFVDYAINKELKVEEYASKVTPIVDPELCAALCKKFNVTDNFLTVKKNADNKVPVFVNSSGTTFTNVGKLDFTDSTGQYVRRILNGNVAKNGYKQASMIQNLSYDTTTAKFKFDIISTIRYNNKTLNLYFKETDLQ